MYSKEKYYLKSPLYFLSSCPKERIFNVKYTKNAAPRMNKIQSIVCPINGKILKVQVKNFPNPKKISVIEINFITL